MGLGIVSDKDFENALGQPNDKGSATPSRIVDKTPLGRGVGNVETPNALRKIIGEEAIVNGRQEALALAGAFGIGGDSVSAYSKGATSTKTYNDTPNKTYLDDVRTKISKRARMTLMRALENITDDKLGNADAPALASVAKSMSGIVKDMEPPIESNLGGMQLNGPSFIFYAPQLKREESYEVIQVNE